MKGNLLSRSTSKLIGAYFFSASKLGCSNSFDSTDTCVIWREEMKRDLEYAFLFNRREVDRWREKVEKQKQFK